MLELRKMITQTNMYVRLICDEPEEAKKDLLIEDAQPVPDLEEVLEDGHAEHSKSDTE